MKIYIASSWKNQHAVDMLTAELRRMGHEVLSFVEKRMEQESKVAAGETSVDEWISSDEWREKFEYDTTGATKSDLVVYIGPSGTDAWAEVGAAWGAGVPVLGLWSKGEPAGLMRRMVTWFGHYKDLLCRVIEDSGPEHGDAT